MKSVLKISFIIPLYNSQETIIRCVDSCIKQASGDLDVEVIVINDGSTDDGASLVKNYKTSNATVILIDQCNQGVSVARNKGIDRASGDYLMFVDSDDYLSFNCVSGLIKAMNDNAIDILAHGAIVENLHSEKHAVTKDIFISSIQSGIEFIKENEGPYKKGQVSGAWGFIVKRDIITESTRFIDGLPFGEDSLFFLRLILEAPYIASTSYCFYHYVQHPNSVMHAKHSIEKITKATLMRCVENRKIMDLIKDKGELRDIILGRLISIAFSRLFLRLLKNKSEAYYGNHAIRMFADEGLWPLPTLPDTHSPYTGKKAFAYKLFSNQYIYRFLLKWRQIKTLNT